VCLRALPAALQVDSFLLFNLVVGKDRETGERGRGVGSGELGGLVLPRLTPGPLPAPDAAEPGGCWPVQGTAWRWVAPESWQLEEPRARTCSAPSLSQQPALADKGTDFR